MVREEIVFGDDEWLCMRTYVEHRRVDTQQGQEQIGTTKCRKGCSYPWERRPQVGYADIQATWDSQTNISEPDRHTNKQDVDDLDDDADSDASTTRQDLR